MRYWDSLGLPQSAAAGALRDIGTPWDCPRALALGTCATLGLLGATPQRWGLPQSAGAGALCDIGTPWDCPKTLALGGRAMLGLVGTAGERWRWSPVRLWDSLELVGTRWDSRDVHPGCVFLDVFAHLGLA